MTVCFRQKLRARAACLRLAAALLPVFLSPDLAQAAVHSYGPAWQRFTLDVPDGWKEDRQETVLHLTAPDGKAALSVRVCQREDRQGEALVRRAAGNLSVSGIRRQDENTWIFYVTSENVTVYNMLRSTKKAIVLVSAAGENDSAKALAATLKVQD